jgi:hypothetical protein
MMKRTGPPCRLSYGLRLRHIGRGRQKRLFMSWCPVELQGQVSALPNGPEVPDLAGDCRLLRKPRV